jgi:hypothetical protein
MIISLYIYNIYIYTRYYITYHQLLQIPTPGVFCWPPEAAFVDGWFKRIAGCGTAGRVEVLKKRKVDFPVSFKI